MPNAETRPLHPQHNQTAGDIAEPLAKLAGIPDRSPVDGLNSITRAEAIDLGCGPGRHAGDNGSSSPVCGFELQTKVRLFF
jgi:hypothetical protein